MHWNKSWWGKIYILRHSVVTKRTNLIKELHRPEGRALFLQLTNTAASSRVIGQIKRVKHIHTTPSIFILTSFSFIFFFNIYMWRFLLIMIGDCNFSDRYSLWRLFLYSTPKENIIVDLPLFRTAVRRIIPSDKQPKVKPPLKNVRCLI